MASNATFRFDAPGATYTDIREALSNITDDDVSVSSPISDSGSEAAVVVNGDTAEVRVDGHDGSWTLTSQEGVIAAVEAADGVEECVSVDGGYDPDDEDEDAE
jgi:hypothetical protein